MDKRVFSKEKESTATFLGLAGMVLRTVIATKETLVREWTHTAVKTTNRWILSLSPVRMR